jgi:hypothetical protein
MKLMKNNTMKHLIMSVVWLVLCTTAKAQTISTYSILSTGYDRPTATFLFPVVSGSVFDPYWYYYQYQNVHYTAPHCYPVPSTEAVSNTLAYVVDPYPGMLVDMAARYINYQTSYMTTDTLLITYRTYFDLPYPLIPADKQYSIKIRMRADDLPYDVRLNGVVFAADTAVSQDSLGNDWGDAYEDSMAVIEIPYCHSAFVPGSNYLELSVADFGVASGLAAEVTLYERTSTELSCNYLPPELPCKDCIGSFAPEPGKKYLVSAWVKEESPAQSKTSYTYPSITIRHPSVTDSTGPFGPSGDIIDGWQRIEAEFTIPALATDLSIKLNCSTGNCYFDDIRIFPFDGSMKSYVYDPVTMRLSAELDERNYATLYEYDEEGKLVRVKKETQKGVMTIKENRNHNKK